MDSTRRYPRTLEEAFPANQGWADPAVMRAVIDAEFPPARWPFETASAVSEFGHDDPPPRPQTVSLLQRIKRKLRALAIKRMKP